MFGLTEQGKDAGAGVLMQHFGQEDITQILCESVFMPEIAEQDKEKILLDCIGRLKAKRAQSRKDELCHQIKMAQHSGDEEKLHQLMHELHSLIKQR